MAKPPVAVAAEPIQSSLEKLVSGLKNISPEILKELQMLLSQAAQETAANKKILEEITKERIALETANATQADLLKRQQAEVERKDQTCARLAAESHKLEANLKELAEKEKTLAELERSVKTEQANILTEYIDRNNNAELAKSLDLHTCDPNAYNKLKNTPLHIAVIDNKYESVAILLAHKANPNLRDIYGRTPLHLVFLSSNKSKALDKVSEDIVMLLLKKANVLIKDTSGKTALEYLQKTTSGDKQPEKYTRIKSAFEASQKELEAIYTNTVQHINNFSKLLNDKKEGQIKAAVKANLSLDAMAKKEIEQCISKLIDGEIEALDQRFLPEQREKFIKQLQQCGKDMQQALSEDSRFSTTPTNRAVLHRSSSLGDIPQQVQTLATKATSASNSPKPQKFNLGTMRSFFNVRKASGSQLAAPPVKTPKHTLG